MEFSSIFYPVLIVITIEYHWVQGGWATGVGNRQNPPFQFGLSHLISRHTQCHDIPEDLRLCQGLGYDRMRLPNLLNHETVTEVVKQSSAWPPLVSSGCHPETRKLLCSLFAPVCMKGYPITVPPCRSLCIAVRDACLPTMASFGYSWPHILNCSVFPSAAKKLCIPGEKLISATEPPLCPACEPNSGLLFELRKQFCGFDFVMKVQVRRFEFRKEGTRIAVQRRTQRIFKRSRPKPNSNALWLRDGLHCTCDVITSAKTRFLVTGWQMGRRLVLNSISKWGRRSRKVVRRMKRRGCPKQRH